MPFHMIAKCQLHVWYVTLSIKLKVRSKITIKMVTVCKKRTKEQRDRTPRGERKWVSRGRREGVRDRVSGEGAENGGGLAIGTVTENQLYLPRLRPRHTSRRD